MWDNAKRRARISNVPFYIEKSDIVIPERCPALGIELRHDYDGQKGSRIPNSPSLDRIIPELGYVKDNIIVVSRLANMIKNNATVEQIGMVFAFYKARQVKLLNERAKR